MSKTAVIALGGNAILSRGQSGDIHQQFSNTRKSLKGVVELIRRGYRVAITHGNGPQAGNEYIRNETAKDIVSPLPLGVIVAETEGWMGYMIAQSLQNKLYKEGINRKVITIPTQVIVSRDDPAWQNPTKPVGPFYTYEKVQNKIEKGEKYIEDAGRGWRKVVPSPEPLEIVEKEGITKLVEMGFIVISAGGGGIPVYKNDGILEGIDGVIDKDKASAVLARDIGANSLIILTDVDYVYLNFGKKEQTPLRWVHLKDVENYYQSGHFYKGSMGPKIEAAITFLKNGGKDVVITSLENAVEGVDGKSGTHITN